MRSRYSAFALGNPDYLLATWHPRTRPTELELDDTLHWYRLDIISTVEGGPFDGAGIVEFEAFYRTHAGAGSQHETSRFVREAGTWLYLDGVA